MTETICYLHDDMDGWASAAIVRKEYPDAEFVKVNYGDEFKICPKDNVIIVDFTFPNDIMEFLVKLKDEGQIKQLIHIDHHISAKQRLPKLWKSDIAGLRKINHGSAAKLTWQYFYPDKEVPKALEYISAYDTWDFKDNENEIKIFIAGLNHHVEKSAPEEYNSDWLNSLLHNEKTTLFEPALKDGYLLLAASEQHADKAIADGVEITFHGHKTLVVNSDSDISLIGEKIYNSDYDIGIIWTARKNNITFGLRSKTVNVSEIAMKYKGGGHRSSSGFERPIKHQVQPTGFDFLNNLLGGKND